MEWPADVFMNVFHDLCAVEWCHDASCMKKNIGCEPLMGLFAVGK